MRIFWKKKELKIIWNVRVYDWFSMIYGKDEKCVAIFICFIIRCHGVSKYSDFYEFFFWWDHVSLKISLISWIIAKITYFHANLPLVRSFFLTIIFHKFLMIQFWAGFLIISRFFIKIKDVFNSHFMFCVQIISNLVSIICDGMNSFNRF